ncbi:MAG TPA: DNA topoisomerase IB [Candidatus Thermoplasmatota archaeon]|nr:DNA topoisomerase IB [Candidatus Thermoplasmatota archaeon]
MAAADPHASARSAGLRYANDSKPGLGRERRGKSFAFLDAEGNVLRNKEHLARIKSLVIPPAWEKVWISPDPRGHIQVTGIDARGRKQYRYHQDWRKVRDESKYEKMAKFGRALPKIRDQVDRDLRRPGLPRMKVLAAVVRMLETTFIRIGNEEYAKENNSFGLTTLRDRHAAIRGGKVELKFRGKSGKEHTIRFTDRRLAQIVRRCQALPGQELFQFMGLDGKVQDVDSSGVNEYLQSATGQPFTAKDFRTWAGTLLAARALAAAGPAGSPTEAKRIIAGAVKEVSRRLGNTPTVCRKSYIHPLVLDLYMNQRLDGRVRPVPLDAPRPFRGLDPSERDVLKLLSRRGA